MLSADPDIRRLMALRAIEGGLLRLKWLAAATRFELAMVRHARALKYSSDQPRVPAGNPDGGQWTDGGSARPSRVRAAGDSPPHGSPPLRRIHPDSTYETDRKATRSLEHWKKQSTGDIVDSLKPGNAESLKVKPNGDIVNGNTRIKILEGRGYNVNSLPREIFGPIGIPPLRGPGGGGGHGTLPPWE